LAQKTTISNRLKNLEEIEGVKVTKTDKGNTVRLEHQKFHSLNFLFKWTQEDHFNGYFVDANGNQSQAVITLRNGMDAISFGAAYSLLISLRAKQKKKK